MHGAEGAESVGHQAIIIGGVREPYIIRQLDSWLTGMQDRFAARVQEMFGGRLKRGDYDIQCFDEGVVREEYVRFSDQGEAKLGLRDAKAKHLNHRRRRCGYAPANLVCRDRGSHS